MKTYIGDVGTIIRVNVGVNLYNVVKTSDGATGDDPLPRFEVTKPDGNIVEWQAEVEDTANGILYYEIANGDLDMAGNYKLQAKVKLGSDVWYGATATFKVYERFN